MGEIKRIGVLSGGDAPGMNVAVRATVRTAANMGMERVGIRHGWEGLIQGKFFPMDRDSVEHIRYRDGTILYTATKER